MTHLHNGHQLRDPLPGELLPTLADKDVLCLPGWSPLGIRVRTQALREVGVGWSVFSRPMKCGGMRRGEGLAAHRALVWRRMRQIQIPGLGCLSYPDIAAVTNSHHSTVISAIRRLDEAEQAQKEVMR